MYDANKVKLEIALRYSKKIRDKTITLVNELNNLIDNVNENCVVDDKGVNVDELQKIKKELNSSIPMLKNRVIYSLKRRIDSIESYLREQAKEKAKEQ